MFALFAPKCVFHNNTDSVIRVYDENELETSFYRLITIRSDGSCLFGALSYILYDDQDHADYLRARIVQYVVDHWDSYRHATYAEDGNNYSDATVYFAEMSKHTTYGSMCELQAASDLYARKFHVYRDGRRYTTAVPTIACDNSDSDVDNYKLLYFKNNLSGGHFDVLIKLIC